MLMKIPSPDHAEAIHRPFACPYKGCTKRYRYSADLKFHVDSHKGRKPFKCMHPGCGKRFTRKRILKEHQNCHTGRRPNVCHICKKTFTWKANLSRHISCMHKGRRVRRRKSAHDNNKQPSSSPPPSSYRYQKLMKLKLNQDITKSPPLALITPKSWNILGHPGSKTTLRRTSPLPAFRSLPSQSPAPGLSLSCNSTTLDTVDHPMLKKKSFSYILI